MKAIMNSEQSPKSAEMSAKDEQVFNVTVEKCVAGLESLETNKAKDKK